MPIVTFPCSRSRDRVLGRIEVKLCGDSKANEATSASHLFLLSLYPVTCILTASSV